MIGVCGCGCTGSSAVLDLLKEFDNLTVLDKKEFVITYFPNGIEDLESNLMTQKAKFFSSDIAICNFLKYTKEICHKENSYYNLLTGGNFEFLVKDYINKITQIQWRGRWMYDDIVFKSFIHKLLIFIETRVKFLEQKALRDVYFSIEPSNFYEETERFLENIYNYYKKESLFILDQPFPSNNPINSMRLYGKSTKAIIVERDPRDIYVQLKKRKNNNKYWLPIDDINGFITYYSKMYSKINGNQNILYIHFEDLLYDYDKTVSIICDFCGIDMKNHINKKKYFDPHKSISNTKLFIGCDEYKEDIRNIENRMSQYLYDFPNND